MEESRSGKEAIGLAASSTHEQEGAPQRTQASQVSAGDNIEKLNH